MFSYGFISKFVWMFGLFYPSRGLNISRLDDEVGPVVFVNVLFRHGDRNVIDLCPTDPYRNRSFWPEGFGQLTKPGKLHHYQLGSWIRKRYWRLIPKGEYDSSVIHVQSTDVDRTLMSAEANLAGLFPPDPSETWSDINWQPIPVHTIPENIDKLMSMEPRCKKYEKLMEEFKKSKTYIRLNKKYQKVFEVASKNCGKEIPDIFALNELYSQFTIETLRGFKLPSWISTVFPDKMAEPAGISFALNTWTDGLKRLRGGPLVKEMLNNIVNKSSTVDATTRNISVYSAHDTTLGNTMNTLGVYNFVSPPFYATLLVELRSSKTGPAVTILYKNGTDPLTDDSLHLLQIPGCSAACPLSEFERLLSPVIPRNWDAECNSINSIFGFTSDSSYASIIVFGIFSLALVLFALFATASVCWSKQHSSYFYRKLNTDVL